MSQHTISPEISFAPQHESGTKKIWKTFWLLSAITVVELGIGLSIYTIHKGDHPNSTLVLFFKGMVCILTLAKAYYIVSIFMHLGNEIRNMIMTVVVPLILFVWFLTAFLWDGNSWKNLRNTNGGSKEYIEKVTPASKEKGKKD
ncbi:MAG TPA: cytochrome C oxidase subunit IV family protein [Ferruginibacter sp.]|nr:cytochrome C oxidase subunit IV family protein [Ferruginibacter sp.]